MEYGYEFGTWNVISLYKAGSLKAVKREIARYKLDLVGGQWHRTCGRIHIFLWKGKWES
jgi:hypothetical protein